MTLEALNSPVAAHVHDSSAASFDHWVKKKRSKRPRHDTAPISTSTTEEEYLALCLIMLARGGAAPSPKAAAASPPPPPPLEAPKSAYTCTVCGKAFASFQALGGHKASHRKNDDEKSTSSAAAVAVISSGGKGHECSVCHRVFPTGQALGGHKRRHYEGVIGGAKKTGSAATTTTTSDGVGSTVTHRGFDLNLPALPDFLGFEEMEVESPHPLKKPQLLLRD